MLFSWKLHFLCSDSALFVTGLSRQSMKCISLNVAIKSPQVSLKENLYFNIYYHRRRTEPKENSVIFQIFCIFWTSLAEDLPELCAFFLKRKIFSKFGDADWGMATFVLLADFILNVVLPNLCEIFFWRGIWMCFFITIQNILIVAI